MSTDNKNKNEVGKKFWYEPLLDHGLIPDFILRIAIRNLLKERLDWIESNDITNNYQRKLKYINSLREKPIAEHTDKANEQHYEVSTEFIKICLGKRVKYSCNLFQNGNESLDAAEEAMLESYCIKARITDGMEILDLGCGWGSLCLYLCEKYPNVKVTALSNSSSQREHIESIAKQNDFKNLKIITADVKEFEFDSSIQFDRIMSIEMFEHMKNYEFLFAKISKWLKPKGLLFCHIFCHANQPYDFTVGDGWMSKHFFTGGTMPSADLFLYFQNQLRIIDQWAVSGKHYAQTSEEWAKLLSKNKKVAIEYLAKTYGEENAVVWYHRWRTFYIAVAEMFNYNNGNTWFVCHYLFEKEQ